MVGALRLRHLAVLIALCAVFFGSNPAAASRWGADTLADDDASDLLSQIVANGSVATIRIVLDAALTSTSPVDDERASRALAAAELVAAMVGKPSRNLPAPSKEWAILHTKDANRDLVRFAVGAVDRITKDSEMRELMQEGGAKSLLEWETNITNLRARLISR